jgi:hypothetical protein
MRQVLRGEGRGQGGDAPRIDDQEERPAEEETGQRAVGLAQVNIEAAGLGIGRRELRQRQGAEDAQHAAGDPHGEHEERRAHLAGHRRGDDEDARADHGADDDADDAADAEDTDERRVRAAARAIVTEGERQFAGSHAAILSAFAAQGNEESDPRSFPDHRLCQERESSPMHSGGGSGMAKPSVRSALAGCRSTLPRLRERRR